MNPGVEGLHPTGFRKAPYFIYNISRFFRLTLYHWIPVALSSVEGLNLQLQHCEWNIKENNSCRWNNYHLILPLDVSIPYSHFLIELRFIGPSSKTTQSLKGGSFLSKCWWHFLNKVWLLVHSKLSRTAFSPKFQWYFPTNMHHHDTAPNTCSTRNTLFNTKQKEVNA